MKIRHNKHVWLPAKRRQTTIWGVCVCVCVRATHHGNGIRGEQLLGTHGRDVGDVCEDVHEGDEGDGDEDGTREVPGDGEKKNSNV